MSLFYCLLVWIVLFQNIKQHKVHERAVKVVLNDYTSDSETFQNNNNVCNHHRNIQNLLIEIFKTKMIFAPPTMGSTFKRGNTT